MTQHHWYFNSHQPLAWDDETYSVDFDGSTEYVRVPNDSSLEHPTGSQQRFSMSCSAWIKVDSFPEVATLILDHRSGSTGRGWQVRLVDSGALQFYAEQSASDYFYRIGSASKISPGTWYHAVWTATTKGGISSEIKLYIDSVEDTGTQSSRSDSFNWVNTVDTDLTIGRKDSNGTFYLDGHIAEVAWWKTVLTQDEVTALYNSGAPTDVRRNFGNYTSAQDLMGYYRMGDMGDTYDNLQDLSKNKNHGSGQNMDSSNITTDVP